MKRSPESTANRFTAIYHSGVDRTLPAAMLRSASHSSLIAASSLGKCPRVLMIFLRQVQALNDIRNRYDISSTLTIRPCAERAVGVW